MEKSWEQKTAEEKREELIGKWLSPEGVEYNSPEAEKSYKERVTRLLDAVELKKEPDRVPIVPMLGFYPAHYCGYTPYDVMYDYDKLLEAWEKCYLEIQADAHGGAVVSPPGRLFEILDYKLYAWPGHGVAKEHSYQCNEGEYMLADEYDALIEDPTLYFLTTYYPRIFGKLGALGAFPTITNNLEMYGGFSAVSFIPFGVPDVQDAFKLMFEAGAEALKWIEPVGIFTAKMTAAGLAKAGAHIDARPKVSTFAMYASRPSSARSSAKANGSVSSPPGPNTPSAIAACTSGRRSMFTNSRRTRSS